MNKVSFFHEKVEFRKPTSADGAALNVLVAKSPPLDSNSVYCNLLQCTHFASTSVAAVLNNRLVGFVSGYFPPDTPRTLFVWQVVVDDSVRGSGLAKKMLAWLIEQPACKTLSNIATTITADNEASWALFEGFARVRGASVKKSLMFDAQTHFAGEHDDEYLLTLSNLFPRSQKSMQEHLNDLKGHVQSRRSR